MVFPYLDQWSDDGPNKSSHPTTTATTNKIIQISSNYVLWGKGQRASFCFLEIPNKLPHCNLNAFLLSQKGLPEKLFQPLSLIGVKFRALPFRHIRPRNKQHRKDIYAVNRITMLVNLNSNKLIISTAFSIL